MAIEKRHPDIALKSEVVIPMPPKKVRFLVWFTGALDRFNGVKAHHLTTVQAYFKDLGLSGNQTIDEFDEGLIKFGYGKK